MMPAGVPCGGRRQAQPSRDGPQPVPASLRLRGSQAGPSSQAPGPGWPASPRRTTFSRGLFESEAQPEAGPCSWVTLCPWWGLDGRGHGPMCPAEGTMRLAHAPKWH